MSAPRLIIAGGGTGGHLFPGVAVAEELKRRCPEAELLFIGTERGIETRVLPALGWQLKHIEVSGLKTVGLRGAVRGALRIPGAMLQSRRLITSFQPDLVIGVGGYAAGPVVLAASLMRLPTAILEQNSIPGLTNRILGQVVDQIFLSFAHTRQFFADKKSSLVGNPIREQILDALQEEDSRPKKGRARLFIFGGSQGALAVNEMCCAAAARLRDDGVTLDIVHQTGEMSLEATKVRYQELNIAADCRAFIGDMASEYKAADVIVARAGATTIAELGIARRPAVLIPYPHAANNHQELNAQEMVAGGAALMLAQEGNEDGTRLAELLGGLLGSEVERQTMATAMREFGRPKAAADVVDWILSRCAQ